MTVLTDRPAHQPRKRFGQNFLHDPWVIRQIVASIAPAATDDLVEIGPGQGALTLALLPHCRQLTAIELDRDLAGFLRQQLAAEPRFTLVEADALNVSLATLGAAGQRWRVVGNLPYNISTPLLFHLLAQRQQVRDMHFMLQKEVVDRLAAQPGSKAYGRLSVMAQYACRVTPLFDVPPGAFVPPPKVTSAIVRMVPVEPAVAATNPEKLAQVVAQAFQQRRKTLRNTLKSLLPEAELVAAGIDPAARAETLGVAEFVALANRLDALSC